jgi:branched-chain amino acid transport system ATP-binding protein
MSAPQQAFASDGRGAPSTRGGIEVDGATSGYGQVTVLRNVSISVPAGAVTAILGANGAGKTTLLKTISGTLRPSRGKILMDGAEVTSLRPHERVAKGLCHIPEGRGIFRSLTVRENIVIQARPGEEDAAVALAAESFPALGKKLNQTAGTLSGGQQQMLAMSAAFARSPKYVLVDEPSLGLAPMVVDEIFEFLRGIAASGTALIIVDQFVQRVLDIADTIYILHRGEIVHTGAAGDLSNDQIFATYLGSA